MSDSRSEARKPFQLTEYSRVVDFTSFADGVLEAYREAYGKLEVVPISFREEIQEPEG